MIYIEYIRMFIARYQNLQKKQTTLRKSFTCTPTTNLSQYCIRKIITVARRHKTVATEIKRVVASVTKQPFQRLRFNFNPFELTLLFNRSPLWLIPITIIH